MTTKEAVWLRYWHFCLQECNEYWHRAVTAGELARWTGQSRGTCQKNLSRMIKEKGATAQKVPHWNGAKKTVYLAVVREE